MKPPRGTKTSKSPLETLVTSKSPLEILKSVSSRRRRFKTPMTHMPRNLSRATPRARIEETKPTSKGTSCKSPNELTSRPENPGFIVKWSTRRQTRVTVGPLSVSKKLVAKASKPWMKKSGSQISQLTKNGFGKSDSSATTRASWAQKRTRPMIMRNSNSSLRVSWSSQGISHRSKIANRTSWNFSQKTYQERNNAKSKRMTLTVMRTTRTLTPTSKTPTATRMVTVSTTGITTRNASSATTSPVISSCALLTNAANEAGLFQPVEWKGIYKNSTFEPFCNQIVLNTFFTNKTSIISSLLQLNSNMGFWKKCI